MPKFKQSIQLLTEKGKVKADIRKHMMSKVNAHREIFEKAHEVKSGVYEIPYSSEQADGTIQKIYVRFEVKVSERSASELAEPKKKATNSSDNENIEIEID